jgi:hypothetical protein
MEAVMRALLAMLATLVPSLANAAMDIPARKPGLWQLTVTAERRGLPPQTMKHCIDAETDKTMNSLSGGTQNCLKQDMQHVGNTIVIDSVCRSGKRNTVSHTVVTGDFNSAYTVKSDVTQQDANGALVAYPTTKMTVDAKWLGPCAADQKPGDMIMSNGMKMNINNLPSMHGGMPRR